MSLESLPYYLYAAFCWCLVARHFSNPAFTLPFLSHFAKTTLILSALLISSDYMLFWRPDGLTSIPIRFSYYNAYPNPFSKFSPVTWIGIPLLMGTLITGPESAVYAWRFTNPPRLLRFALAILTALYGTAFLLVGAVFTISTLGGRLMDGNPPGSVILMLIFFSIFLKVAGSSIAGAVGEFFFAGAGYNPATQHAIKVAARWYAKRSDPY